MLRRLLHPHASPSSPPPSPPATAEVPAEGHVALHIPLLDAALTRLEHMEEGVAARLAHSGDGGPPAVPTAVLHVPASSGIGRLFGSPLQGVEAAALGALRRALVSVERSCAHFTCRWMGAGLFAAAGLWAGFAQLRGEPSLLNPGGGRHGAAGYGLLLFSAPLPVLPLMGALVGEGAARLACMRLERAAEATS